MLWAAKAAKIGYCWKIGNGRKVKFWEDQWFGSSSLAIQYWDLYTIVNEQNATVATLWDGDQLKVTFRRCFNHALMTQWYEVLNIAQSINFSDEDDAIIWKYESKGTYSVSSLYAVINFRGVLPVYIHAVWKVKVPPRIHFFLWLLSHNKLLTRDNLLKRQHVDDPSCVLCSDLETCTHLFFECVVAKAVWDELKRVLKQDGLQKSFHYVASMWLDEKKNYNS